jgi:hypothetical protein
MSKHFRRRHCFFDGTTWRQFRDKRWLRTTCDYILSDENQRKIFRSIRIAGTRQYDSDHFALCFTLDSARPKHHKLYQQGRQSFSLKPNPSYLTAADFLLDDLPLKKNKSILGIKLAPHPMPANNTPEQQPQAKSKCAADCSVGYMETHRSTSRSQTTQIS